MMTQSIVQHAQHPPIAGVVSGSSALISFFASTLPVVQWIAASVAIVVGLIAIYPKVKAWWRKGRDVSE